MVVECKNCGEPVTNRYARVRSLPGERRPEACPFCDEKRWNTAGNGVEDARSTRRG